MVLSRIIAGEDVVFYILADIKVRESQFSFFFFLNLRVQNVCLFIGFIFRDIDKADCKL